MNTTRYVPLVRSTNGGFVCFSCRARAQRRYGRRYGPYVKRSWREEETFRAYDISHPNGPVKRRSRVLTDSDNPFAKSFQKYKCDTVFDEAGERTSSRIYGYRSHDAPGIADLESTVRYQEHNDHLPRRRVRREGERVHHFKPSARDGEDNERLVRSLSVRDEGEEEDQRIVRCYGSDAPEITHVSTYPTRDGNGPRLFSPRQRLKSAKAYPKDDSKHLIEHVPYVSADRTVHHEPTYQNWGAGSTHRRVLSNPKAQEEAFAAKLQELTSFSTKMDTEAEQELSTSWEDVWETFQANLAEVCSSQNRSTEADAIQAPSSARSEVVTIDASPPMPAPETTSGWSTSIATSYEPFGSQNHTFAWQKTFSPSRLGGLQACMYHSSSRKMQQAAAALAEDSHQAPIDSQPSERIVGIRAQLRQWQEVHGKEDPMPDFAPDEDIMSDEPTNNLTRLPGRQNAQHAASEEADEESAARAHFMDSSKEGPDGSAADHRYLRTGDLAELDYAKSERESQLGVYIRTMENGESQFFTMSGRWVHVSHRNVLFSIPRWTTREAVEPLLKYLPSDDDMKDKEAFLEQAYVEDLSVPREVGAPLVTKMVQFFEESQEIYRQHADALDNAHNILAHETDLRYGSLASAATALLKIPSHQLPLTALFTVRHALGRGGFAFNVDRRSHRITGYMQIRSKEQVKMVDTVRGWLRQWQDELAATAGMTKDQLARFKRSKGASHITSFLDKAKKIVLRQRQNREPTASGNVGPSKEVFAMTKSEDAVRIKIEELFTTEEEDVIRFLEAWCCSNMFYGLPRIEALPPLLLQATGLYPDIELSSSTGFMFLQEIGTVLPYENRIRFDQHLLLPSSQHSKPLQILMSTLLKMRDSHDFKDSMADLRHDWKDMPVYCIDDPGAHEIDDGISIEKAGEDQYWVHMHIANPTAFFSRDHPLAKMARHMGETIYMAERTYMMLPRWATQRYFSLAPNRPCLTFSAKLDSQGNTLDEKITSGIIRNVIRITPAEVEKLLNPTAAAQSQELVLTAGGNPPPQRSRKSASESIKPEQITELETLHMLADKRESLRRAAGGVFFNTNVPDVSVWQSWKAPGLAWDHPFRKGRRTVTGDPVIQIRTRGLQNPFATSVSMSAILVREMMLLACEIGASWCAKRHVPIIYRGTVKIEGRQDPDEYMRDVLAPATNKEGEYPMHLGIPYIQLLGSTVLRTEPIFHRFMGMQYYSKVTSPLRRYGDMILHWQIEAALRQEATRGSSLVNDLPSTSRSFLPFSAPVLETIMLGLMPRETIIRRAKDNAGYFWLAMLFFRKHYFPDSPTSVGMDGESGALPFQTMKAYIAMDPKSRAGFDPIAIPIMVEELGIYATMVRPDVVGLGEAKTGDRWECAIKKVDVFKRMLEFQPVRLLERWGE